MGAIQLENLCDILPEEERAELLIVEAIKACEDPQERRKLMSAYLTALERQDAEDDARAASPQGGRAGDKKPGMRRQQSIAVLSKAQK